MAEAKSTASKTPAGTTSGLAVASLVTGIVAFIFGWTLFFGFAAGATAIVLGIVALKKRAGGSSKGMSIAGIVTGGVAALWSIVITILFLAALAIGGAATGSIIDQANQALDQYNAENKALVEAKKDFAAGETARFGQFEIKANSVKRNYEPSNSYLKAGDGKEFVVVNVTAKNVGTDSKYISSYDLKIQDGDIATGPSFVPADPSFEASTVLPGGSVTGNIVYQVDKGASNLKLRHEVTVYGLDGSGAKELVFTLAL